MDELHRCVSRLFAAGKGVLAVDISPERFRALSVPRMTDSYLRMVLGAPDLPAFASGVVLAPESLLSGQSVLAPGVLAGVRADAGSEPLSLDGRVRVTAGLDGLGDRLAEVRRAGIGFAVWESVPVAGADDAAMRTLAANGQAAARFAYLCQERSIVPVLRVGARLGGVLEPQRSSVAVTAVLSLIGYLHELDVDLSTVVLSASAADDLDLLSPTMLAVLPVTLGGVLLVGVVPDGAQAPWPVTFQAGEEVTAAALGVWRGRPGSVPAARDELVAGLARISAGLHGPVPSARDAAGAATAQSAGGSR